MNEKRANFERTLSETIKLLCKGEFQKEEKFTINGTIGVSLPNDRVFMVGIHEEIINDNGRNKEEGFNGLRNQSLSHDNEVHDVANFDVLPMIVDNEENHQRKQEGCSSSISSIKWDDESDGVSLSSAHGMIRRDSQTDTDSKRSVINASDEESVTNQVIPVEIKKEAIPISNYKCTDCGKFFDKFSLLKRHKVVHNSTKPYMCSYCDSAFKWRNNAVRHERIVHGKKRDPNSQNVKESLSLSKFDKSSANKRKFDKKPGKKESTDDALMKRRKICNAEKPFVCNICKASFTWKSNLYRHKRFQHEGCNSTVFNCSICNASFGLKIDFSKHMEMHRENTDNGIYEIDVKNIKNGVNEVSSQKRTFTCKICEIKFDNKEGLVSHIIRDHKDLKRLS